MLDSLNILFVDTRNVFRSIVAESLAQKLSAKSGFKGILGFDSCGLSAINGYRVCKDLERMAAELDFKLARQYAQNFYDVALQSFDMVTVFEHWHKSRVENVLKDEGRKADKVFFLGSFVFLESILWPQGMNTREKIGWLNTVELPSVEILTPLSDSYEEKLKTAKIILQGVRNLLYFFARR